MEKKFIVVNYENQNKKIAVHEMTNENITNLINDRFKIQSPDIKYYDKDVDDWVDFGLEADAFIGDLSVLKLRVNKPDNEKTDALDRLPSPLQPNSPVSVRPQTPAGKAQTRIDIPGTLSSFSRPETPNNSAVSIREDPPLPSSITPSTNMHGTAMKSSQGSG